MGIRPGLNGGSGNTDHRLTTCSICGCGIFDRQDRVWSTRPLGLVHADCQPAKTTTGGKP